MSQRSSRRSTFTLDVGVVLRARLNGAAAASGRSASQFTRELLMRALADLDGPRPPSNASPVAPAAGSLPASAPSSSSEPAGLGCRIELDPELSAQLDAYKSRGGFRSRPAAIRFALDTATRYGKPVSAPATTAPDRESFSSAGEFQPLDPAWLKTATQALIQSNAALQPIGNSLNQIARTLNAVPGASSANDANTLTSAQKEIRSHVEQAARLVYSLRTYITPFTGQ